ncbi:angiopoietin-related protein 7-like [Brienomyrus brachyistius]|uniref:angiopoietin-related protein 7-like n=1 Tax=Brienomyrus brachyistius TaxID=42636 RepID=UPI0020B3FBB2|nr:angiopoietin-related protein 7-like [Brienomyrus brachyistius]
MPPLALLLLQSTTILVMWGGRPAGGAGDMGLQENPPCSQYGDRVLPGGQCGITALPTQWGERRCPDAFRCMEEAQRWRRENEQRKQQVLVLKETVSELQEELRHHRHRVKVLELQNEEKNWLNSSLEQRLQDAERHDAEVGSTLRPQGMLVHDMQVQVHNLAALVEKARRNPGCMVNVVRASQLLSAHQALHPDVRQVRSCPMDCASVYHDGIRRSGVYTVVPSMGAWPVEVFCDMDTAGGGWTVIQRRLGGSVSFERSWQEYKLGFGDLHSDFWLGNEHIHTLSRQGGYALRIELEDWSSERKHATYESFSLDGEETQYRLHVSGFSGTVKDSFGWYHNMHAFSTPDIGNICAQISRGGWWYHRCFLTNLNGVYYKGGWYTPRDKRPPGPDGIVWYSWKDSDYYSLKKVSMMIRPRAFRPRPSP